jgi:hypothetical protein
MKKLESLGKRLTKDEQKKITGGFVDPGGTCGTNCDQTCTVTCNGQQVAGTCGINSSTHKCNCSGVC